jgi:hypothetical protein
VSFALSVLTARLSNRKRFVTRPAVRNDIQIDRACSIAISEEIGGRLRIALTSEPNRLPQRMTMLVEELRRPIARQNRSRNKLIEFIQTAADPAFVKTPR